MKAARPSSTLLVRGFGAAMALGLLAVTFRKADWGLVQATLGSLGPLVLIVPLPQLMWLLAETVGWQWGFGLLGRRVELGRLLRVRICMEALGTTLPGGVLLSESLAPQLLRRHGGIPIAEGVTGVLARKFLLLASQAAYMLLVFVVGLRSLSLASERAIGRPGLEWAVCLGAVTLGVVALLVRFTLHRGAVVERGHAVLRRIPLRRWQGYLARISRRCRETDGQMARFFGSKKRRLGVPALPFLLAWLLESAETWLLLQLIGVDLGFFVVASFEVVVVFVFRHLMFLLPAGLGAQEAGYVVFLDALGVPDPVSMGACFVVLKRSKELFWAVIGFWLLLGDRRQRWQPAGELTVPSA